MRDWMGFCQRCSKESNGHIMSMYNEQLICFECKVAEEKRSDYKAAQDADIEAIRQGNFNFKGVGHR